MYTVCVFVYKILIIEVVCLVAPDTSYWLICFDWQLSWTTTAPEVETPAPGPCSDIRTSRT